MSNRLHVVKKYVVEYADEAFFNWKQFDINNLLNDFGNGCVYFGGSEDNYNRYIEIDSDDFLNIIEKIKNTPDNELSEKYANLTNRTGYAKKEIISGLTYLYENRDPNHSYIRLEWF